MDIIHASRRIERSHNQFTLGPNEATLFCLFKLLSDDLQPNSYLWELRWFCGERTADNVLHLDMDSSGTPLVPTNYPTCTRLSAYWTNIYYCSSWKVKYGMYKWPCVVSYRSIKMFLTGKIGRTADPTLPLCPELSMLILTIDNFWQSDRIGFFQLRRSDIDGIDSSRVFFPNKESIEKADIFRPNQPIISQCTNAKFYPTWKCIKKCDIIRLTISLDSTAHAILCDPRDIRLHIKPQTGKSGEKYTWRCLRNGSQKTKTRAVFAIYDLKLNEKNTVWNSGEKGPISSCYFIGINS